MADVRLNHPRENACFGGLLSAGVSAWGIPCVGLEIDVDPAHSVGKVAGVVSFPMDLRCVIS